MRFQSSGTVCPDQKCIGRHRGAFESFPERGGEPEARALNWKDLPARKELEKGGGRGVATTLTEPASGELAFSFRFPISHPLRRDRLLILIANRVHV